MNESLSALIANERIADLHRAANGRRAVRASRRPRRAPVSSARTAAAVRLAQPHEAGTLWRLAQLDDAPELAGTILVAMIDADVVAALSLEDGRVVADPFVLTSDAVKLLRRSAMALTGRGRWRSGLRLRPRLA